MMTDGTAVMVKIGRLSPTHQQLCFAHGVQLAVIDVLYKKQSSDQPKSQEDDSSSEDDSDEDDECEFDEFSIFQTSSNEEVQITHSLIRPLIDKARKTVRKFRKAPLHNEALQKYVQADFGKELHLILDCKTRWSSLQAMLERFVMLKNCIRKSLIDLKSKVSFEQWEFDRLLDITRALESLKLTVDAICRRDANLLTADAAMDFALTNLQSQNSSISLELAEALRIRISERRTEYSALLQYLHSGKHTIESENADVISSSPKSRIALMLKGLVNRFHPETEELNNTVEDNNTAGEQPDLPESNNKKDAKFELNQLLQQIESRAHVEKPQSSRNILATIKKEMATFEAGGSRGQYLQEMYNHMKSISPTSVESERAFSSAGYFCSKIRSRLNDETLSELIFLRSHFRFCSKQVRN